MVTSSDAARSPASGPCCARARSTAPTCGPSCRPRTGIVVSVRCVRASALHPLGRGRARFVDLLGPRACPCARATRGAPANRCGVGCRGGAASSRRERRIDGDAVGGRVGDRLARETAAIDERGGRAAGRCAPGSGPASGSSLERSLPRLVTATPTIARLSTSVASCTLYAGR